MDVATPRPKTIRRFTLLDAMILVAATACGLAVDGAIQSSVTLADEDVFDSMIRLVGEGEFAELGAVALVFVLPVVASLNLSVIPLGLLKPRPRVRRLACRPGWMAACAVALVLAFELAVVLVLACGDFFGPDPLPEMLLLFPALVVPAILGAWLTLALGRRWRPEPSWIDRLGRALAVCWLVLAVLGTVVTVIYQL